MPFRVASQNPCHLVGREGETGRALHLFLKLGGIGSRCLQDSPEGAVLSSQEAQLGFARVVPTGPVRLTVGQRLLLAPPSRIGERKTPGAMIGGHHHQCLRVVGLKAKSQAQRLVEVQDLLEQGRGVVVVARIVMRPPSTMRKNPPTTLLENGYDIRTIQEFLGHRDVRTMMYTHVLNRGGRGVRSPLD